jgi:hypothetical protein
MELDKEFFDNLNKLEKFKTNPDLNIFFDSIEKLKILREEISGKKSKTSSDKSKLGKQAQVLTKNLADRKNELALRTKTQKEYDAVYACIDYLDKHFNYNK